MEIQGRTRHATPESVGQGHGGFSLVELLVALVLAAFLFLSAGSMTLGSFRTSTLNENRSVATTLAEGVLECLKRQFRNGSALNGNCNPNALPAGFSAPVIQIQPNPAGFTGSTRFTVTVSWGGAIPGSVILATLENS